MWPEAASSRGRAGHFVFAVRLWSSLSAELATDQIKAYLFVRGYEDDHNHCIATLLHRRGCQPNGRLALRVD